VSRGAEGVLRVHGLLQVTSRTGAIMHQRQLFCGTLDASECACCTRRIPSTSYAHDLIVLSTCSNDFQKCRKQQQAFEEVAFAARKDLKK